MFRPFPWAIIILNTSMYTAKYYLPVLFFYFFKFFTFNFYFQLLQHLKMEILCKFAISQIIFRGIHN
jgi:hypothetical protein